MTVSSKIKHVMKSSTMRVYIYPFVFANIFVICLAFLFQFKMHQNLVFGICSSIVYLSMFWIIVKRYRQIIGQQMPKRSLIFLTILIVFLCLSMIAEVLS